MSMSLSFVRLSCSSHSISPSFSHLPPQLPNSRASHFVFCRYRRRHVSGSSSISRGIFKVCSFSTLGGASEFDSLSQRSHDEEEDDEQQIRTRANDEDEVDDEEEEEEEESISSYVFPERWDVLGLGQAMVIFLFILIAHSYVCGKSMCLDVGNDFGLTYLSLFYLCQTFPESLSKTTYHVNEVTISTYFHYFFYRAIKTYLCQTFPESL